MRGVILFILCLIVCVVSLQVEVSFDNGKQWISRGTIQLDKLGFVEETKTDFSPFYGKIGLYRIGNSMNTATFSQKQEVFQLHFDDEGKLVGFSITSSLSPEKRVILMKPQPIPDIVFVEKPKPVETKDGVPVEEDQSFFRKYWYYILPLVLLVLFGGTGVEEPAAE
jgi:hypothetical protein